MKKDMFSPPNTLVQQVSKHIADRIIGGFYGNGHQLKILELANEYSTSQGTIREALQLLEASFLVKSIPRRGFFVKVMSPAELYDVWEIKKRLWSYVFRLFCINNRGKSDVLQEYSDMVDRIAEDGEKQDHESAYKHIFTCVNFVSRNCGNGQLHIILSNFEAQGRRYRRQSLRLDNNLSETVRLMSLGRDAALGNNPDLAEACQAELMDMDRRTLINNLDHLIL